MNPVAASARLPDARGQRVLHDGQSGAGRGCRGEPGHALLRETARGQADESRDRAPSKVSDRAIHHLTGGRDRGM